MRRDGNRSRPDSVAKGVLEARAVDLLGRGALAADRALLVELVVAALRRGGLAAEVLGDGGGDAGVVDVLRGRVRLGDEARLVKDAELVDAVKAVLNGVVRKAAVRSQVSDREKATRGENVDVLTLEDDALEPTEVVGMDGDAVVVLSLAGADVAPVAVDLAEVHAGGVGEEEEAAEDAEGAEGEGEPELGAVVDVVEEDSWDEGAELAARSRESVCGDEGSGSSSRRRSEEEKQRTGSRTDRGGVDLGSGEEGDGVRAELVPERREVVHELDCSIAMAIHRDQRDRIIFTGETWNAQALTGAPGT